jgi:hypothetical protein
LLPGVQAASNAMPVNPADNLSNSRLDNFAVIFLVSSMEKRIHTLKERF